MKPRLLYIRMLRSRPAQVVCSLWQQIDCNDLFTHVAALTYTTVLSVVPLLALLLAVGRGFGLDRYLEAQLRDHVSLPDHIVTQLMDFANSYISRTQDDIVVGVSFLVLAFTLISLVNNIERRFNAMWGINTSRSIFSFSLSYLGLIVFLIFAIFFLSGVWVVLLKLLNYLPHFSLIDNSAPVIFWIVKALVVSGVFALMFKYIPLVPVRWRSIYFPALLTGTLFCAVQDLYVNSQLFISSYNAVYGSFAILPLLMMWLYVTWSICLGGVALCHTLEQQAQPFADEKDVLLNRQMSDVVALRLMGLLARRFLEGQSSWPVHRLARELRLPVRTTFDALDACALRAISIECPRQKKTPATPTATARCIRSMSMCTASRSVRFCSDSTSSAPDFRPLSLGARPKAAKLGALCSPSAEIGDICSPKISQFPKFDRQTNAATHKGSRRFCFSVVDKHLSVRRQRTEISLRATPFALVSAEDPPQSALRCGLSPRR